MKLLIMSLFSLLVSCSNLSEKGVLVELREKVYSEDLETYRKIGEVACRNEIYMVTRNYNMQLCIDNMRNEAASLGADFLIVTKTDKLPGFFSTGVDMRAEAYKKHTEN